MGYTCWNADKEVVRDHKETLIMNVNMIPQKLTRITRLSVISYLSGLLKMTPCRLVLSVLGALANHHDKPSPFFPFYGHVS